MNKRSFLAELKRRNVLRVGMFWGGGVWALGQGLAQLFPTFGFPDWIVRWFIIAGIIGLPFVMMFAWFYEFTAEGLKLESEIAVDDASAHRTGKKMDRWIIAVLALAVVLLLTNQFVLRNDATSKAEVPIPPKSVAVLPFENLSTDPANKFFVSGMQDMILTKLADVADLKVISRTSTKDYKSRPDDLKMVGQQLGVATVLEGSVQKAGNQVLITVQLIDTDSQNHVWANSYTRSLEKVFDVEGEVAKAVADALKAKLTPMEATRLSTAATQNGQAYQLFVKGQGYSLRASTSFSDSDYASAIDYFRQATEADPNYALAYAEMALTQARRAHYIANSQPDWLVQAGEWAAKALALAPDLAEAHLAQGYFRYYSQHDLKGALESFQAAHKLKPQDADVYLALGTIEKHLGDVREAVAAYSRGAVLDPRNVGVLSELAVVEMMQHDYASAREVLKRALAIEPASMMVLNNLSLAYTLGSGDIDSARAALDAAPANVQSNPSMTVQRANLAFLEHDYASAKKLWGQVKPGYLSEDAIVGSLADVAWAAGNTDVAHQQYQRAIGLMQKVIASNPGAQSSLAGYLGLNYARMGVADKAAPLAQQVVSEHPLSGDVPLAMSNLLIAAQIHASLGQTDAAVEKLRQLSRLPSGYVVSAAMLKIDPSWNPIREQAAFKALLKQYADLGSAQPKN